MTAESKANDVVRLVNLRKVYGGGAKAKVAVRGVSLGIQRGECFGYLGINGAGKTSTLKILTADVLPTSGEAFIDGLDTMEHQDSIRSLIGYCPQHDALLELLTVREHLELFARIKAVPESDVPAVVAQKMQELNLKPFEHKLAGALSGGNKRKLSVAIAMIGVKAPPIVLLDEPSTGMDPVNKRFMWEVIARICIDKKECSIILTTHSMEECEALCNRAGIMVGGRLRCLGSLVQLKNKFGQGYQLDLKLKNFYGAVEQEAEITAALAARQGNLAYGLQHYVETAIGLLAGKDTTLLQRRLLLLAPGQAASYGLQQLFFQRGDITALELAEWWFELGATEQLVAFMAKKLPTAELIENHDTHFRYKVPSRDLRLAALFQMFEAAKQSLGISEYAVAQTTLEQIFNQFAAQQEEETGTIRGVQ